MITTLKILALVMTIGLDNLVISTTVGMINIKGKLKIAAAFICAEAVMPLIGVVFGQAAGRLIGSWASVSGGILLIGLGIWLIFFEDDDEDDKLKQRLAGWSLLLTAVTLSLDELAVGFSIGLIGVPVVITIAAIVAGSFIFTMTGMYFGSKIKRYLGEWTEKLGGLILLILGLWILIDKI